MSGLMSLDGFLTARAAVIGDIMLDHSVEGEGERISPEAPVPVVRFKSERGMPGGAADVAALGGHVIDRDWPAATKLRVVGHRQRITRSDREGRVVPDGAGEAEPIRRARVAVERSDVPVVGTRLGSPDRCRPLAWHRGSAGARHPGRRRPKRRDLTADRGATVVTPYRAELTLATGLPADTDGEVIAAARAAQAQRGADLLVTRSERGMSFIPRAGDPAHLAAVARDVFDVSGAGDTVVATLAIALAAGMPVVEPMRAADHAAGIVVGRSGTATVRRSELAAALHEPVVGRDVGDGRLLAFDDLLALRQVWRGRRLVVGYTNGCFDLLHPGPVSLMSQTAACCDRLIVALNTGGSVQRLKGTLRPLRAGAARARVVGEDQVVGAEVVRVSGGTVLLAALRDGQSTKRLVTRATKGTSR